MVRREIRSTLIDSVDADLNNTRWNEHTGIKGHLWRRCHIATRCLPPCRTYAAAWLAISQLLSASQQWR